MTMTYDTSQWWLDGVRGKKLDDIEVGASYTSQ
jgi:hypothetical protein